MRVVGGDAEQRLAGLERQVQQVGGVAPAPVALRPAVEDLEARHAVGREQDLGREAAPVRVRVVRHAALALSVVALQQEGETVTYSSDHPVADPMAMTSLNRPGAIGSTANSAPVTIRRCSVEGRRVIFQWSVIARTSNPAHS